jgi:hypothetical protein
MDELTDDVVAFLSEGTRTGKLGYTASDGRPLVAPSGSSSTTASWPSTPVRTPPKAMLWPVTRGR